LHRVIFFRLSLSAFGMTSYKEFVLTFSELDQNTDCIAEYSRRKNNLRCYLPLSNEIHHCPVL